jgi:hypothetical protein
MGVYTRTFKGQDHKASRPTCFPAASINAQGSNGIDPTLVEMCVRGLAARHKVTPLRNVLHFMVVESTASGFVLVYLTTPVKLRRLGLHTVEG